MSKVFMTLSIFIRMLAGLGVFALLARGLGPRQFGFLSLVFGYASLGSLLTDFGLAMKMLRDIAHDPADGHAILSSTLRLKITLSVSVTVLGFVAVLFLPINAEAKLSSIFLTAGVMAASYGDLALVAFRSVRKFGRESWIVGWTSLAYSLVLGTILAAGGNLLVVSVAFLVCRVGYAAIALREAIRLFPRNQGGQHPVSLLSTVKSAWSWALLSNLSYVNGQIDTILIAPLLGLHDTGVYQAGAKFAGSAVTFASVVTNTQVPPIAAAAAAGQPTLRLELLAWGQMILIGAVFGLVLTFGGPLITRYLIGPQYAQVNSLWLGMGAMTFCRFLSSAILVSLVALNQSKRNLLGEATTTIMSIPLMIGLVPHFGLVCVPWIMAASALATAAVLVMGRFQADATSRFETVFSGT